MRSYPQPAIQTPFYAAAIAKQKAYEAQRDDWRASNPILTKNKLLERERKET